MHALMLAAGLGERLRPHTLRWAKPAIPFLNLPMLSFPLFFLEQAGLKSLVVNTHHLPESVRHAVTQVASGAYLSHFSHEEPEILGSGGGLAKARSYFADADDVVIFNADTVSLFGSGTPVADLLATHKREQALATLYLCPFPPGAKGFGGAYVDAAGRVRQFSKVQLNDPTLRAHHFTGLMAVSSRLFAHLQVKPSNLLYDDLQPLMNRGERVAAHVDRDVLWFETGNEADYLRATRHCLELLCTDRPHAVQLKQILSRFAPGWDNFKQGGTFSHQALPEGLGEALLALIGRHAKVDDASLLRSFVVLGDHSHVHAGASVEASVIGPNVVISRGTSLISKLVL